MSTSRRQRASCWARTWIAFFLMVPAVMMGPLPRAAASPVREARVEGFHKGPWLMTSCTWTDCGDIPRRQRLEWGFSPARRGIDLKSYSGGYHLPLRWLPEKGMYRGSRDVGRWWRRSVELKVVEQARIDGVWTATKLVGTTRVWSKSAPRYHDSGRFTLYRRFGLGHLVFQSGQHLFTMDGDGTDVRPVGGICEGFEPSWRPSTKEIAFIHRCGPTGTFEVSAIGVDGTGLRELVATDTDESGPDWSNDGRLTLTSDSAGNRDVFVADANGNGLTNLTNDAATDAYPAFSPDGTQIVFTSDRGGNFDLYVMDADGTDVRQVTSNPADDGAAGGGWGGGPSWSPSGRLIAFESDRSGDLEIYTINVKTGDISRITRNRGTDVNPSFSPDGTRLAFSSDRGGDFDIYTVGTRGQDLIRVSNRPGDDYQPDWQTS